MDQIQKVVLSSPENACYNFCVGIEIEGETARKFTISGGESATRIYRLIESSHDAYLDLFYHIASDFGLRLPKNRELNDKPKYTEQINYNPISLCLNVYRPDFDLPSFPLWRLRSLVFSVIRPTPSPERACV
ncbi:MAG: hypothetical protein EOP39_02880 [Rubrivivax sp.]|nr:MAG: hypothetical protein EOP39_02880 [Rubrivivax sp.]